MSTQVVDRRQRSLDFEPKLLGPPADFDGPAYAPRFDRERLTTQLARIRDLMLDGAWRTLREIEAATGYPAASVSAQLRHLRKARFGAYRVTKRRRGAATAGLFEYHVAKGEV